MPRNPNIKKVLVIGSGPIIIGQAAEFDYAGTQACRALKEEGIEVVLVNSNPATIMTDSNIADRVYLEPLTPEVVKNIIRRETAGQHAAHAGRADGPEPGGGTGRERLSGRDGREAAGHAGGFHPQGGGPGGIQGHDAGNRRARASTASS